MRINFEKIKLPLSIAISVILIISVAALIVTVQSGRADAIYVMNEKASQIDKDSNISVYDVLSSVDNLNLPEKYKTVTAEYLNSSTGRKYTQYEVISATGSVTVRSYNYAYLTEDEPVKIPDDAMKIQKDNIEIFIFTNKDNTSTALYYSGLSRYIIKENCSVPELEKIFSEQP